MNPERKEFLNLLSLPGRISATEAAWKLGFETDHITILGQLPDCSSRWAIRRQAP
jgi:hypothetical protein